MSLWGLKKENTDEMKIIDRDIGFIEDSFGMICDMVAFEDHCDPSFVSTKDENNLSDKNWMRNMRSRYLDRIAKNTKGNDWCRLKHLCRIAKGLQELSSRFLSVGDIESSKQCAEDWGETYLKFLNIAGYTKGETNTKSSA